MTKYHVSFKVDNEDRSTTIEAKDRDFVERVVNNNFPLATDVNIRTYSGYLDEKIRNLIDKVKINAYYPDKVQERLRCSADAALMFGTDSQESLENVLDRVIACSWEITGLDSHMFSFGFKSNAGYYGGIIFHCNAKEWSSHT